MIPVSPSYQAIVVSKDTFAQGQRCHKYVRDANCMTSRAAMLMLFGLCLDCEVILEQPLSSLMFLHPRMRQLVDLSVYRCIRPLLQITTFMGSFGAESLKPTFLVGSPPWLDKLRRDAEWFRSASSTQPHRTATYKEDDFGMTRFTGDQGLKATQIYPVGYGHAICERCLFEPIDTDTTFDFDWDKLKSFASQLGVYGDAHWLDAAVGNVWAIVAPRP